MEINSRGGRDRAERERESREEGDCRKERDRAGKKREDGGVREKI